MTMELTDRTVLVAGLGVSGAAAARVLLEATARSIAIASSVALLSGLLGTALAWLVTRTELLLIVTGGLFVAVTLSVVIQVAFFRATRRRVFRMAPLHHHFELAGWTENTVIVRFWLVTGMAVAFGLGLFYADWLTITGL